MRFLDALDGPVIFLAAFLLFLVEPMTAKRLLPLLGGSAAVWITCLVFFQCALLAGYLYAHSMVSRLRAKTQAIAHTGLLVISLCATVLTLRGPEAANASRHPLAGTLGLLTMMIGLPFVALAATTPLVQSWREGRRQGWRIYALSNAGSILALAFYPWLIEPRFALGTQRVDWAVGFGVFAFACGALAWRRAISPIPASAVRDGSEEDPGQPVRETGAQRDAMSSALGLFEADSAADAQALERFASARRRPRAIERQAAGDADKAVNPATGGGSLVRCALWILLPAASSMLLCAVTAHLSRNVAAVPLLWVVPLAAYLLSFVVTFAGPRWYARSYALRTLALAMATVGYLLAKQAYEPLMIAIPLHVGALFVFCYFCHGELYRMRPPPNEASRFYLLLALGSALGATAIGVAAPMLFRVNYDLVLSLVFLALLTIVATWDFGIAVRTFWVAGAAAMMWAAALNLRAVQEHVVSELRGFYGSLRVTEFFAIPGPGIQRTLYNGTIQHGTQIFNDVLRRWPTSYYAPDSGVGLAVRFCCGKAPRHIGVVGLGVGTIAAYGEPGDTIVFYEIDPLVERLARARFTYLRECRAQVSVIEGDARLSLDHEVPQNFDVLALDAFSGDAVPVHLLTAEAIDLYRRHLKPSGVLAFHVSSQYVDLKPVLAAEARHAGLTAFAFHSEANYRVGEFQADWVLMSADRAFFRQPDVANAAEPLAERPDVPLWTDDFNSLFPLIRWTGKAQDAAPARDK
jgi:SAM-dependent methyltransferase